MGFNVLSKERALKERVSDFWHMMSPRENDNPGQDLVSKLENPSMFYSAVKKDKHSLRKKVVRNNNIIIITMMMPMVKN